MVRSAWGDPASASSVALGPRMHSGPSGPYEKLIDPQLWFKNSEPPHGMQRATLPMCFQKGWGAGTAALARKLREKHGLRVPE